MTPGQAAEIESVALRYRNDIQQIFRQGGTRLRVHRSDFPGHINEDVDLFWRLVDAFKARHKVRVEVPGGFTGTEIILHWEQP